MVPTLPFGSQNGPFSAASDLDQAETLPSNPNHVDLDTIDTDTGPQIENDRWGLEWTELDTQPMIRLAPPPEREYPDLKMAKDSVQQWAMEHRYAIRTQRSKTRKSGGIYKVFLQCDRAGQYLDPRPHSVDHPHKKRRLTGTRKTNCPFCVVVTESDGVWRVTVQESAHNHEPSGPFADQAAHRRTHIRHPFVQSVIRTDMNSGATARETVQSLDRIVNPVSFTRRDIYNARADMKRSGTTS